MSTNHTTKSRCSALSSRLSALALEASDLVSLLEAEDISPWECELYLAGPAQSLRMVSEEMYWSMDRAWSATTGERFSQLEAARALAESIPADRRAKYAPRRALRGAGFYRRVEQIMSASSPIEPLLTVADVAQRLRVTEQTVRNWIARGLLPYVRVGQRRIRIRRSDFDRFTGLRSGHAVQPGEGESPAIDGSSVRRWQPSEPEARDRFLATAVDVADLMLHDRRAELAPGLRALARCAERWAQALES